jgi:hypothetical protein
MLSRSHCDDAAGASSLPDGDDAHEAQIESSKNKIE